MIYFLNFSIRRVLLLTSVLILGITAIVAQNVNPLHEVDPAETGQVPSNANVRDFQAYQGEEYLVYPKGDTYYFYNPATGEEYPNVIPRDPWEIKYQGNLGKQVLVSERHETRNDQSFTFSTYKQTASNGNVITYNPADNRPNIPTVSVPGYPDIVLEGELRTDSHGEYIIETIPYGWIDRTHLLVAKGNVPSPYAGIFSLDIITGAEKEILSGWDSRDEKVVNKEYVELQSLSPSGRYLLYQKPIGLWTSHDGGKTELILYDLMTGSKKKIADDAYPIWMTTKEISQGPGEPGFSFSPSACVSPTCGYNSSLTFKLPFKCGEAYRVTRDGECFTPWECLFGDGGYPIATWNQGSGTAHAGKKALDFSNNYLGGTGSDDMPVLAAQTGVLKHKGFDSDFGYNVWLLHSDGTYTFYCHLKEQVSWALGVTIPQGQTIGIEGCTGTGCTGQHIHFARCIVMNGAGPNSRWMTFDELGPNQIPTDEHIYISKNGSCPITACNSGNVSLIYSCGQTVGGSTTSLANSRATYFAPMQGFNAATLNMTGREKIYQINVTVPGTITATLSNTAYSPTGTGYKLYPFIVGPGISCANIDPLLHCKGTYSNNNQTVTYTAPYGGTYYIIVDGSAPNGVATGASGTYTLSVTAPCGTGGGTNVQNLTDFGTTKVASGCTVIPTVRVINNGNVPSSNFTTRLTLSLDTYFSSNDFWLGGVSYPSLPAGYAHAFTNTWSVSGVPAGTYYILELIDYLNTAAESNENDNGWYLGSPISVPNCFAGEMEDRNATVVGIVTITDEGEVLADTTEFANIFPATSREVNNTLSACVVNINGFEISATNVSENSEYFVSNLLGQPVCSGKAKDGSIKCEVKVAGIYSLTIIDGAGNKCSQKVFVKR